MKKSGSLGVFGLLAGLAIALPAAAEGRHTIDEICTGDCKWEKVATCEGFIEGINVDDEGGIYVLGYMTGQILKVEGESCTQIGAASGSPNGAKLDAGGNLIVTDRTGGLQKVDLETGEREVLHTMVGTAQFRGLNDLVIDSQGGMYFSEPYGSNALNKVGKVYYLGPDEGAVPEVFAEGLAFPNGLAISANGLRVYIAEYGQNRVISVPSKLETNIHETPFVFARMVGGIGPDGMTVDSEGNLYAAHFQAGEVVVFDKLGFPYGALPLPEGAQSFTTNVAIHDGYLYLTEALQNVIWRMPISKQKLKWDQ